MRSTAKYGTLINLLFLAIISIAFTGKALHAHSDEYYNDYLRTGSVADDQSSISDNCPICHFQFFFFLYAVTPIFIFAALLPVCRIGIQMHFGFGEEHPPFSQRAPPTESQVIIVAPSARS